MSYDIIYDKQFVKLPDNNFIPMILSGCNNVIDYSNSWRGGRGRRSRSWNSHDYITRGSESKFFASGELILKNTQKIIDECIASHANVKKDYEDKIYTEAEVKKSFGYFMGLAVRTQNTSQCNSTKYFNLYKNGVKDALTIEELDKIGINIEFYIYTWHDYKFSIPKPEWDQKSILTTEEFFKTLKEVNEYTKNCVITTESGKTENVHVYIHFGGSDTTVSDKLKRNRKNSKKKPVRYDYVKADHFFTLRNNNGYLKRYTAKGYRYSYSYPMKHYRTEKEAQKFKDYLIRTKKSDAQSWNVIRYDREYTFRIPVYN